MSNNQYNETAWPKPSQPTQQPTKPLQETDPNWKQTTRNPNDPKPWH